MPYLNVGYRYILSTNWMTQIALFFSFSSDNRYCTSRAYESPSLMLLCQTVVRLLGKPVFSCCCHAQLLTRASSGRFCQLFTKSDGQLRALTASLWVGALRIDSLGCEHPWITLALRKVGRCLSWCQSLRSGNWCSRSQTEQEKDRAQNIPFRRTCSSRGSLNLNLTV